MLFGKKDKKPSDRVLDLKARVDALRAVDEATRKKAYSLEHFLEGDDVLTGRSLEDDYTPQGFDSSAPRAENNAGAEGHVEVNLQAELDKYIQRQADMEHAAEGGAADKSPSPSPEVAPKSRPLESNWGRDGDPLRAPPEPIADGANAWPGEETNWSAPRSSAVEPKAWAIDDAEPPAWPDSLQWPSEEEWPPREKAV